MALIVPEGYLTYLGQMYDGITTRFGMSRDWRFDKGGWAGRWVEWIEPLKCIAPWGLKQPEDMDTDDWVVSPEHNTRFLPWTGTGGKGVVKGYKFYDGSVYPAGTALQTFCGIVGTVGASLSPNVLLSTKLYHPPAGQGVIPQMSLRIPATWTGDGVNWVNAGVLLWLPHHSELYNRAMLYCHVGPETDDINVLWDTEGSGGFQMSEGPSSGAMSQGPKAEVWAIEYIEIWKDEATGELYAQEDVEAGTVFVASHILVRHGQEMQNWWHYTSPSLRLLSGNQYVTCGGAHAWFNVTPIPYSWACPNATGDVVRDAWPMVGRPIPTATGGDANAWNDTGRTFDLLESYATDWSNTVALDPATGNRPRVTFTPVGDDLLNRPVVWAVGEQINAVIDDAVQPGTPETTNDASTLLRLQFSLNKRWQGAQGSCVFLHSEDETERYASWKVNAKIGITAGWQAGAGTHLAAQLLSNMYIKPDGIRRGRVGDAVTGGAPYMEVEFGDFSEVRAARKEIMDLRQAGGMTVSAWAHMIANRMGIPTDTDPPGDQLYVDPTIAGNIIPVCPDVPSVPTLAPTDGTKYLSHIREVEKSARIRVGFNRQMEGNWYVMAVDAGPPAYVYGVSPIVLEIDYATAVEEDQIDRLTSQPSGDAFRNVLKAKYGRPMKLQVGAERDTLEWYWAEPLATRKATIGDDWGAVVRDDDAVYAGDVFEQFVDEHYDTWGRLDWHSIVRTDLLPDAFVKITNLPGVDVDTGYVYQIGESGFDLDFEHSECVLSLKAELVYPRYEGTYYYS